jgi:small-conductance mechanosensitive channel
MNFYFFLNLGLHLLFFHLTIIGSSQTLEKPPKKDSILSYDSTSLPNQNDLLKEYNKAYYNLQKLNVGLDSIPNGVNLQTPQAALEHFILSSREERFDLAAYAINLNLLPNDLQKEKAKILAKKLYYVISKRIQLDWNKVPDRPDGQIDVTSNSNSQVAGKPRRTITLGSLGLDGREVPIDLQRVKLKGKAPIWVISSNSAENIEPLYSQYGPSQILDYIPEWLQFQLLDIPFWKILGFILTLLISLLIFLVTKKALYSSTATDEQWISEIGNKIATPLGLFFAILFFYLVNNHLLSLSGNLSPYFYAFVLTFVIGSATWVILRAIDYIMDRLSSMYIDDVSEEQNLQARRYITYLSVARRVVTFIVLLIGIGIILSQFENLQTAGISILASAGIATIILGIAAQSTLGNIIAGLQVAITRPARIGDSILFEGEYGWVEDIRFMYLVVRTWDKRRVIVPLQYFISHPFQNWSMNSPHMLKPIYLYADYKIDVEKVRAYFSEILKQEEKYDEEAPPTLQVTSCSKEGIEMRALCSAKDAADAWDLHCKIREKLAKFVGELEQGIYLSRERVEIINSG